MRPSLGLLAIALWAGAPSVAAQKTEPSYAFSRFVGEWKLKDDQFQQVLDGETVETLSIPSHRTVCSRVNTDSSVLCQVDAVDLEGHILWAVQNDGSSVSHLSHFGSSRLGDGTGTLDEAGNLSLTIRFSDEPPGTYRHYSYSWVSTDEYYMISRQYNAEGKPTGNWYGGGFIRVRNEPK